MSWFVKHSLGDFVLIATVNRKMFFFLNIKKGYELSGKRNMFWYGSKFV